LVERDVLWSIVIRGYDIVRKFLCRLDIFVQKQDLYVTTSGFRMAYSGRRCTSSAKVAHSHMK
jgi:hypothetical protein